MIRNNIPLKVAIGYGVVAIVLVMAIGLVYGNTQSILNINKASHEYTYKRDVADSLVYSLLDVSNNERAIYMGTSEDWEGLNKSIQESTSLTLKLKNLEKDSMQKARMDTLIQLLTLKRENLKQLTYILAKNAQNSFLHEKVSNLNSGKDSILVHPKTPQTHEDKSTTVAVVKTRKGFFHRLADAFKKGRTDTLYISKDSNRTTTDSISTPINVTEKVANVLTQIGKEEKEETRQKEQVVNREVADLQKVSALLAQRTASLLSTIRQSEKQSVEEAFNQALNARQRLLWQISLLALVAMTAAIILLWYIFRDSKKERIYREDLEDANAEIQRVMNQRERLLLTITHDIKAPAASISGFIDLLKDYVTDHRAISCLNNISSSAKHLSKLVASLLDYHQLENGKMELHPVTFSPSLLIKDCAEGMRWKAEEKGLILTYKTLATPSCGQISPVQSVFQADAFRIRQILDNLVSNAIKYTATGEIAIIGSIEKISTDKNHAYQFIVKVKDTGQGMTEEEKQKVFQAFTRLKGAQGIEGTGLGLSITRELVALLHGEIRLQSEKGKGSTFTVCIPMDLSLNAFLDGIKKEESESERPSLSAPEFSPKGNHKILILDDDSLQLKLLQEMLHRICHEDWQIFPCQHISDALTALHDEQPSLMMMDIEMPEMNGMELIKHINHNHIKVIAMTAHDASILPELKQAGFDDCLFKPFNLKKLEKILGIAKLDKEEEKGKEEEEKEAKAAPNPRFTSLLAFAENDKEAEKEILSTLLSELIGYKEQLAHLENGNIHRDKIGKIAHKLLPIASMLHLECINKIQQLSPEHIQEIDDNDIIPFTKVLLEEINDVAQELTTSLENL